MTRLSLLGVAVLGFVSVSLTLAAVPMMGPLQNAAVPNLMIPAVGLGTGGYAFNPAVGYGGYPECFDDASGCDEYSTRAVLDWFHAGGRRLDLANTYGNMRSVGRALSMTNVKRSEMFILEKIGPGQFDIPLGYNDTLTQFDQILENLDVSHVDLLLIHWPTQVIPQSSDAACRLGSKSYDEKECRLSTWRAMLRIFDSKRARAVGVSNFNITHLEEIRQAGLRLPAYNQCPFHLYRSTSQQALIDYCKMHNITFGGYSPLGVPDWHYYEADGFAWTPMADPAVMAAADAHGKTPAQVLLQWQYALGIPTNPRSQNARHMAENLAAYDFNLTDAEMKTLGTRPQDQCITDPSWYECNNGTSRGEGYGTLFSKLFNNLFN